MCPEIVADLDSKPAGACVARALQQLLDRDKYLLTHDANERSITARLAMHLQQQFADWDVDCEYNRDGIDPKRLGHLDLQSDENDEHARTVFPDIIVHRRGTTENHLVIEVKKSSSTVSCDADLRKLQRYKQQLGYEHALFIKFLCDGQADVAVAKWVDGQESSDANSCPRSPA